MGKANMSYQREPKLVKPCSEEWNVRMSTKWQGNTGKLKRYFRK